MAAVPREYLGPIQREGAKIDSWARKTYGISGATLLAKLGKGEGNFAHGRSNPSYAGARGAYQFMPGTRAGILKETGADAYGSPAQQTRAARIYLRRGGLQGYNPGGGQQYVDYILKQPVGHIGGKRSTAAPVRVPAAPGTPDVSQPGLAIPDAQNGSQGLAALLAQAQAPPPPPVTGPAAPSFSAQNALALPQGYAPPSAPPAQPAASFSDLLAAATQQPGAVGATGPDGLPTPEGTANYYPPPKRTSRHTVGRTGGSVQFSPGANRGGVPTQGVVKKFVRTISSIYGKPLTVGTGTNHSQFVAGTNRQSDHWTGHAVDIPARGQTLIRMGQAALIAAGMSPRQAHKQQGGLYNIHGHQVIFNTYEGGDHTDHLHVSAY